MAFEETELQQIRQVMRDELRTVIKEVARTQSGEFQMPVLVSRAEASVKAGKSPDTIKRWQEQGKLKKYGKGRGAAQVDLVELMAFLASPEAKPADEVSDDEWAATKLRAVKR